MRLCVLQNGDQLRRMQARHFGKFLLTKSMCAKLVISSLDAIHAHTFRTYVVLHNSVAANFPSFISCKDLEATLFLCSKLALKATQVVSLSCGAR